MRNIKSYILLAAFAFSATSCLDKYPEDAILADRAITNIDEADQAVIGIYSSFLNSALYSGALTLLPDIQADLAYAVNGYTNVYGDIWRWDILATNSNITAVYGSLYDVIGRCNFLLDNADRVRKNTTNDEELDRLEQYCGEAYFARALAYSELIKMYCKSYESKTDAEKELGVVLVSHYDTNESMKRSSLAASYQFVLDDLDRAAEYLALDDDYNAATDGYLYNSTYFNVYTVYALRSRVALYMKDYDEAIKYATKVIDSKQYVLSSSSKEYNSSGISYYQYMWSSDNSTEVIWKVGFTINNHGSALGTIFFNYDYRTMRPDYVPAQWVLDLYDTADLRPSAFFQTITTGYSHGLQWPLLAKYWGNTEFTDQKILHTCMPKVFRLSEQYLIRAEAYSQKAQPDYSKAGKDITALRTARYSSYGGSTTMSKDNSLDIIEKERVKELYMEGFRLMDLKRWHKGFTRKQQTQTLTNGSTLKIEKDNPYFVWPIPQHELESPDADIEPNESNK